MWQAEERKLKEEADELACQARAPPTAAASPPLRLGDRQLAALVSPALLHFGYAEPELAGWGAVGCAVRLAAHRLLGTAHHPPTTIHRTLRALAAAASAASAAAGRRDDGAAVVEAWQATAEVRSILSAAAALGQEDEHAQAMRPSSLAPMRYEPTAADDDAAVDEAGSRPQKRRRTAAGLAALRVVTRLGICGHQLLYGFGRRRKGSCCTESYT